MIRELIGDRMPRSSDVHFAYSQDHLLLVNRSAYTEIETISRLASVPFGRVSPIFVVWAHWFREKYWKRQKVVQDIS